LPAVFILVDGCRADIFYEMLGQGQLPNIQKHVASRGTAIKSAVTVFPSTTGPAHAPFLTGEFPGPLNMPGIRWFDRYRNDYRTYGPLAWLMFERDYVGPGAFAMNTDMNSETQTIFERLKDSVTAAIFEPVTRGAKFIYPPLANVLAKLFSPLRVFTWEHVDAAAAHMFELVYKCSSSIRKLKFPTEPPVFSAIYMPGVDEVSHEFGPLSMETKTALQNVDKQVGLIARTLLSTGLYDDTTIIISSDHGLRSTEMHFDLARFLSTIGLDVRYFPVTFLQGLGEFDATVAVSGNGMAHVYLAAEGAEEKALPLQYIKHDWRIKPSLQALENYKVRKGRVNIIDLLRGLVPIQHVFLSENKTTFHVFSYDGHGIIRKTGQNDYSYEIDGKSDPLSYDSLVKRGKIVYKERMNDKEWLAATCDAEFPDAPVQIAQIFESKRSGDLIINSRMGWDLMPETPPHHGTHGGLHSAEMKVPLLVTTRHQHIESDKPLRTLDVFNMLLDD